MSVLEYPIFKYVFESLWSSKIFNEFKFENKLEIISPLKDELYTKLFKFFLSPSSESNVTLFNNQFLNNYLKAYEDHKYLKNLS